jgi:hypothetical protein
MPLCEPYRITTGEIGPAARCMVFRQKAVVTGCYIMCARRAMAATYADDIKHACGQYQATWGKCRPNLSECHIQG